jgi:hypothetical protein
LPAIAALTALAVVATSSEAFAHQQPGESSRYTPENVGASPSGWVFLVIDLQEWNGTRCTEINLNLILDNIIQ